MVVGNRLPVALFGYEPVEPMTLETVYFNSTSYDPDGSIVNWTWNMDDGTVLYGEQVTHVYGSAGSYGVNLTVKDDDDATAWVVHTVVVNNIPPTANDDTASTNQDTPIWINVLINDDDPDGELDPTSVTVVSGPSHGSTNINTTSGEIQYIPTTGYHGSDSFKYTVKDNNGAVSNEATVTITVLERHEIILKKGWNIISAPYYDSIAKENITVYYDDESHTWSEAIDDGYILGFLYNFNRTSQSYDGFSDSLEPGYGYWIWAYNNCTLLLYSNEEGTGHITDLKDGWNIMGLPYRTSIEKTSTYIQNATGTYSWNDAVSYGIILGFIYGWDIENQVYELCDTFEPNRGYWMYAHQDCTIKK